MTTPPPKTCPFCVVTPDRAFYQGARVIGLWDAFPVSPGHALVVPRRHIASWFEASPDEQADLLRAISVAKAAIETEHRPDGYNIGINVGLAAGQTVFHLHVHVIPRYTGDVADPRGGVRHVIPGKANYLAERTTQPAQRSDAPHTRALVRGGEADPLLPHLVTHLDRAASVDIATAFTLESGVRLLEEHLRDVLARAGRVRLVTGDYLGVTEPEALLRLLDLQSDAQLQGDIHLRILESKGTSFHPKAYILVDREGEGTWNYRVITSRDEEGFADVVDAFESLFYHPATRPLDAEWVRAYEGRRTAPIARQAGIEPEPVGPPPEPHPIQQEALRALETTREEGNTAGLVVLATGLGKTWLSAFDSNRPEFRRILFVAHREEILAQAMRTFRTIRPLATLGYYTGTEKAPDAEVLFASIQTLGRQRHLRRFDPRQFDYVIIDEFHHAAAQTYRRLINHLEPKFLLGLTATPERTDGGDLLSLCGDNLVYRRDLADGIRLGLLSPFSYFGVPDEVDYANIPWRSNRFDETELTNRVATRTRAENALGQLRRYGGRRTIGFCVSQRHADFMAEHFREAGVRAVAVHAGEGSAPRAHSLERLEAGELDVVFAVDMFNEGVDLPNVDTILMLRPTESRILWLQQFGRGLRHRPGKTLSVIDYIGNHRVFLTRTRALLSLGEGDRAVAYALEQLEAGSFELPPGCSVTYELEATEILRALIRPPAREDALRAYYEDFRSGHGARPLAIEAFQDGYDPKAARSGYGSWLDFVRSMGDFTAAQEAVWERHGAFLRELEVTPMTRSYKMLVLLGMLAEDAFPGSIPIERLGHRFAELARRYTAVRTEVGEALEDPAALRRLIETNPIEAWTGGGGTGGVAYFSYEGEELGTTFTVPTEQREALQDLVWEIAEWRLGVYLRRVGPTRGAGRIVCRVSHAEGRPTLFLPDRTRHEGVPDGWQDILADREPYQAKFEKDAVETVTAPGSDGNVLPEILRRWFGPDAGRPGRTDTVVFERSGSAYIMMPADRVAERSGPALWQRYARSEVPALFGITLTGWDQQAGIVNRPEGVLLFVTLEKGDLAEEYRYRDRFLSPTEFQWQSQNRTTQRSELAQTLAHHRERATDVHLFVRRRPKVGGQTLPFLYCGTLEFVRWEGEKPITVWWRLREAVPEGLWGELGIGGAAEEG